MKKIIFIAILGCFAISSSFAQSYEQVMTTILNNSPHINVLNLQYSADSLSLRMGLNPADPELSYEYGLTDGANEVSISQSFDFPTVYHQRNKVAKHSIDKAYLNKMAMKRELLLKASELYQGLVYQNRMVELYSMRVLGMEALELKSLLAVKTGKMTLLEQRKIEMLKVTAFNDLSDAKEKKATVQSQLEAMGAKFNELPSTFFEYTFTGTKDEFVAAATVADWAFQAIKTDSLIAMRTLKLARNEWIPQLSVGYTANFYDPSGFSNKVSVGISVPLWSKRNNVKHAKAFVEAANANIEVATNDINASLSTLYDQYSVAYISNKRWIESNYTEYLSLLEKSFNVGQITSMEFLQEMNALQDIESEILTSRYNYALVAGRMAIYLQ